MPAGLGPAASERPHAANGPGRGQDGALRLVGLTTRQEFLAVAGARRKFTTPGLMLQAMARPDGDGSLAGIGFTASRKVGNAVRRNRTKRRLRALARTVLARVALGATDYVLVGRTETATRPFPALVEDLETALRRLGLKRTVPS